MNRCRYAGAVFADIEVLLYTTVESEAKETLICLSYEQRCFSLLHYPTDDRRFTAYGWLQYGAKLLQ